LSLENEYGSSMSLSGGISGCWFIWARLHRD
jgi:hypothetical protein